MAQPFKKALHLSHFLLTGFFWCMKPWPRSVWINQENPAVCVKQKDYGTSLPIVCITDSNVIIGITTEGKSNRTFENDGE